MERNLEKNFLSVDLEGGFLPNRTSLGGKVNRSSWACADSDEDRRVQRPPPPLHPGSMGVDVPWVPPCTASGRYPQLRRSRRRSTERSGGPAGADTVNVFEHALDTLAAVSTLPHHESSLAKHGPAH